MPAKRNIMTWNRFINMKSFYHLIIFIILIVPIQAGSQTFQRLYPGTRSIIWEMFMFSDTSGLLLSDQLLVLRQGRWQPLAVTENLKITLLHATGLEDFWFTVNTELSTSEIYHYYQGKLVVVPSFFANEVTAMDFQKPGFGLFVSQSEIAIWRHGEFIRKPSLPGNLQVKKAIMFSEDDYCLLTKTGQLYLYKGGQFTRCLLNEKVLDIYNRSGNLFFLCSKKIYKVRNQKPELMIFDERLNAMLKIAVTSDDVMFVAGSDRAYRITGNRWNTVADLPGITFRGILINLINNTWLYGDYGILLHNGPTDVEKYDPAYPGFTRHKILDFGIKTDDEYGVALTDVNGDGLDDIYSICIYNANKLYINSLTNDLWISPEAGFSEEAVRRKATGISEMMSIPIPTELQLGVAAADFDNDGDQDLYLCSLNSKNKLLINNGKGFFRDVSHQKDRACSSQDRSNAVAIADVDLDGDLDLFVTNETGSNRLYINNGSAYFTDLTEASGLTSAEGGMCASFSDFDHDGYPDLCVSFWNAIPRLYKNTTRNGIVRFNDITAKTPLIRDQSPKSNAVAFADINNDGWSDLLICGRNSQNRLYINNTKGGFTNLSTQYLPDSLMMTNGAAFADMNQDGYTDLFLSNVGENFFFENLQGRKFRDATLEYGLRSGGYSTGCAVADIDNDGDLDLYVANYINENSALYLNRMEVKQSVTFILRGNISNRDAIGAKIWLFSKSRLDNHDSLIGYKEIICGEGYGSCNTKRVIMAIDTASVCRVKIKFPSSADTIRIDSLSVGALIEVNELQGSRNHLVSMKNAIENYLTDREYIKESVKYLLVISLMFIYLGGFRRGSRRIFMMRMISVTVLFILFAVVNQLLIFNRNPLLFYLAPLLVLPGLFLIHLVTERLILRKITENEKRTLREKIARDLHDDLASTLSTISIYSDTLKMASLSNQENSIQNLTEKISDLTHNAKQSITDIIWMTSPRNDTLQNLFVKITGMMADTFQEAGINFVNNVTTTDVVITLDESVKNNLFLILKEGMNNILKHSKSTDVAFLVKMENNACLVELTDNGIGIGNPQAERVSLKGHGITNMYRRAAESGIEFEIRNGAINGTTLRLMFSISPERVIRKRLVRS